MLAEREVPHAFEAVRNLMVNSRPQTRARLYTTKSDVWPAAPEGVGAVRARMSLTASTRRPAALSADSCSQIRMTVQPAPSSWRVVSRSRSRFFRIFASHHAALALGHVACWGQPCQKQPSTNTASLTRVKAMSIVRRGKPVTGRPTRYRSPSRCRARRSANSGSVSFRRWRCIRPLTPAELGTGRWGTAPP